MLLASLAIPIRTTKALTARGTILLNKAGASELEGWMRVVSCCSPAFLNETCRRKSVEGTANCSTKCTTGTDIRRTARGRRGPFSTWPKRALPLAGPAAECWAYESSIACRGSAAGSLSAAGQPRLPSASAPRPPSWEWPLAPRPAVLRAFDPPDKPWMSGHRGVDLGAAHDGVRSPAGVRYRQFRGRGGGPARNHHRSRGRAAEQL